MHGLHDATEIGHGPQCCKSSPFSTSGWRIVQSAKKERVSPIAAASAKSAVIAPWISVSQTIGMPFSFKSAFAAQGMMPSSPCKAFQHWIAPALQWYFAIRRSIATASPATF